MPVITISRMFGSGGSEVAARVADTLGWTLLDNLLKGASGQAVQNLNAMIGEPETTSLL